MSKTAFDLQTIIKSSHHEDQRRIAIDEYGDEKLWVSINVQGGSASIVLTFEEVKRLIEAMNKVMEA